MTAQPVVDMASRVRTLALSLPFLLLPLRAAPASPAATAAAKILRDQCAGCHSGATKSSDFSVETLDAVVAGGKKHGRAVAGGHPETSPLIRMVKGELSPRMPLGKTLSGEQIAALEAWIREIPPPVAVPAASTAKWTWPFRKPQPQTPPAVRNALWVKNPEYAARGGSTGARYGSLDAVGWHDGNSGNQTHPVGKKEANGFGLYDMLGNVWEWTSDWYGEYGAAAATDPKGPVSGTLRLLRGGSWSNDPSYVRASLRGWVEPADRNNYFGFRCVGE